MLEVKNEYSINCQMIIESLIEKDADVAEEVKFLVDNYSDENVVYSIKDINNIMARNGLATNKEYITAYKRLREILTNIKEIKEADKGIKFDGSHLLKLNIPVKSLGIIKDIKTNSWYLDFGNWKFGEIRTKLYHDLEYIYAVDKYNNKYIFKFENNKYILTKAYTEKYNNRLLFENLNYLSPFGISKMIE